jgi:peptidoglycan/LPS O-acetylase OafA/YrhL
MGALRLFLAMAVFLEHFDHQVLTQSDLPFSILFVDNINGARAVLLFYVISGFLISFVLTEKYSVDRSGALAFYRSRFLRIYPLWWVVLAFCFVVFGLRGKASLLWLVSVPLLGLDWTVGLTNYPDRYLGHSGARYRCGMDARSRAYLLCVCAVASAP